MPRKPPTERISASISWFLIAMSVISPTVSSFWLVTLRPFSLELNISSLETVENLASGDALPTVLLSWARTGVARIASDAAINAIFFIGSSSIAYVNDNARRERTFRDLNPEPLRRSATAFVVETGEQRLHRI